MPTVSVDKEDLWERLERKYCMYAMLLMVFRHRLD
jgi:hypothetical protein